MRRSLGCLIVVLVLAGALAGCQTTVDRPEPPSPAEVSSAKGSMEADAESPGGQQVDLIGLLPTDYFKLKKTQEGIDKRERRLLKEYVAKAVSDFQAKGSSKLRATLEGVRKARDDGYDLAPLCEPKIMFDAWKNRYLRQLYRAGQNEFDVKFDPPDVSNDCQKQNSEILIWVNVVVAQVRKTRVEFIQKEVESSDFNFIADLDPNDLGSEVICSMRDEALRKQCQEAFEANSSAESVHLFLATLNTTTTNTDIIELDVKKEAFLIYYIFDRRTNKLTEGTYLYTDARTFILSENSQAIKDFQNNPVTLSMWNLIDDFIKHGNKGNQSLTESLQKMSDEDVKQEIQKMADEDAKQAITCLDPKNLPNQGNNRALRSPDAGESSPSMLMESTVYIRRETARTTFSGGGTGIQYKHGTGFYVGDYLVLTNHHVIENSPIVDMHRQDDEYFFNGVVIGYDKRRDLALVKAEKKGNKVPIHDGGLPNLGDEVSAYGHPRGYRFTYTRGVISHNSRVINWRDSPYDDELPVNYIQTDAAINQGNSGGPLIHAGQVIGVNTRIVRKADPDPAVEGTNFAVRYDEIHAFLKQQGLTYRTDRPKGHLQRYFGCVPSPR